MIPQAQHAAECNIGKYENTNDILALFNACFFWLPVKDRCEVCTQRGILQGSSGPMQGQDPYVFFTHCFAIRW